MYELDEVERKSNIYVIRQKIDKIYLIIQNNSDKMIFGYNSLKIIHGP